MDPSSRTFGSEIIIRALSGAFVVLAILGGILLGGIYWSFIVTLITMVSLWEFYNLLSVKVKVTRGIGFISALLLIAAATLNFSSAAILAITALIPFLVLCIEIIRRQMLQNSHAIFNMGGTLVGLIFIALPWTFLVLLRAEPWGTMLLITLFDLHVELRYHGLPRRSPLGKNLSLRKCEPEKDMGRIRGRRGRKPFLRRAPGLRLAVSTLPASPAGASLRPRRANRRPWRIPAETRSRRQRCWKTDTRPWWDAGPFRQHPRQCHARFPDL